MYYALLLLDLNFKVWWILFKPHQINMFDIMYVLSRPYFEQQLELVDISIASLKGISFVFASLLGVVRFWWVCFSFRLWVTCILDVLDDEEISSTCHALCPCFLKSAMLSSFTSLSLRVGSWCNALRLAGHARGMFAATLDVFYTSIDFSFKKHLRLSSVPCFPFSKVQEPVSLF